MSNKYKNIHKKTRKYTIVGIMFLTFMIFGHNMYCQDNKIEFVRYVNKLEGTGLNNVRDINTRYEHIPELDDKSTIDTTTEETFAVNKLYYSSINSFREVQGANGDIFWDGVDELINLHDKNVNKDGFANLVLARYLEARVCQLLIEHIVLSDDSLEKYNERLTNITNRRYAREQELKIISRVTGKEILSDINNTKYYYLLFSNFTGTSVEEQPLRYRFEVHMGKANIDEVYMNNDIKQLLRINMMADWGMEIINSLYKLKNAIRELPKQDMKQCTRIVGTADVIVVDKQETWGSGSNLIDLCEVIKYVNKDGNLNRYMRLDITEKDIIDIPNDAKK